MKVRKMLTAGPSEVESSSCCASASRAVTSVTGGTRGSDRRMTAPSLEAADHTRRGIQIACEQKVSFEDLSNLSRRMPIETRTPGVAESSTTGRYQATRVVTMLLALSLLGLGAFFLGRQTAPAYRRQLVGSLTPRLDVALGP